MMHFVIFRYVTIDFSRCSAARCERIRETLTLAAKRWESLWTGNENLRDSPFLSQLFIDCLFLVQRHLRERFGSGGCCYSFST